MQMTNSIEIGNMQWIPNYALSFDGVDDYVLITNDGTGTFDTPSYTIECDVYVDSLSYYIVLWSYDYTSHVNPYYAQQLRINGNGMIYFGFNNGTGYLAEINTTIGVISTGQRYHIVATYTSGNQKIYVDGVEKASGTYAYTIDYFADYFAQEVWIGKANYSITKACEIDEVRFWSDVRTQTEIQDNMNKELTGNETGLVAYYKMNEGSGTTLIDSAGTNDGTINGATWQEVE